MHFGRVRVTNFRCLEDVEVLLDRFSCAVGHNNAGKSSLMMALSLFVSGDRLAPSDFYSPGSDAVIDVTIDRITEADLARLTEEQRNRVAALVSPDGSLRLLRRCKPDGTSSFRQMSRVPIEDRLREDTVADLLKGLKGKELRDTITISFPELVSGIDKLTTQAAVKQAVADLRAALPSDKLIEAETSLSTGIDESIVNLLPEVIYIPAVQDVTDALKTKEAASFGKIVRVLLDLIANTDQVKHIVDSFDELRKLLNRVILPDGTVVDTRINEIREIELSIQHNLKEQFADVRLELEVPPPELKSVFSGARIMLDDGVRGSAETKGDGVKRALTFSLLRSYVELRRKAKAAAKGEAAAANRAYLFLFEEPELYLHPRAQRVLYDALASISDEHQVCVSTHSPFFLTAESKGVFIRVKKIAGVQPGSAPRATMTRLNLKEGIPPRDAFQLICYENNTAAFFADRIVLVEGESDQIFLKHVTKLLNPLWDFDGRNVAPIRTGGKGSLERYWAFFDRFGVDVKIVADLDVIAEGFDKLRPTKDEIELRDDLLKKADAMILSLQEEAGMGADKAKKLAAEMTFVQQMKRVREIVQRVAAGEKASKDEADELDHLAHRINTLSRVWALRELADLRPLLWELIAKLRLRGVNVLEKGAIDDYYPIGTTGTDKPSKALAACRLVTTAAEADACCRVLTEDGVSASEIRLICSSLFAS